MSELGHLLSEARTAKELTLAEVEATTRIRQKYLEALEAGDYSALPQGATGRGFLRNYARFLDLDLADVVTRYAEESGDTGQLLPLDQEVKSRTIDYRPLEVELIDDPSGAGWWRWAVGSVLALALLVAVGWALLGGRFNWAMPDWKLLSTLNQPLVLAKQQPTATITSTATVVAVQLATATAPSAPASPATRVAIPTSDLLPYPTPTLPPTVTPTPRPTATPEVVGHIAMDMRITQRSWMHIEVDGAVAEEALLEPGEERTWEAGQALLVRTGNAGGVNLTLNGEDLGTMGDVGQVIDRKWVVDQGQVVEATATLPEGTGTGAATEVVDTAQPAESTQVVESTPTAEDTQATEIPATETEPPTATPTPSG